MGVFCFCIWAWVFYKALPLLCMWIFILRSLFVYNVDNPVSVSPPVLLLKFYQDIKRFGKTGSGGGSTLGTTVSVLWCWPVWFMTTPFVFQAPEGFHTCSPWRQPTKAPPLIRIAPGHPHLALPFTLESQSFRELEAYLALTTAISFRIHHWGFRKPSTALAGVAQWTECWPVNQRVARSIPTQGTCLGSRQAQIDVLSLSPFFSLCKNK